MLAESEKYVIVATFRKVDQVGLAAFEIIEKCLHLFLKRHNAVHTFVFTRQMCALANFCVFHIRVGPGLHFAARNQLICIHKSVE